MARIVVFDSGLGSLSVIRAIQRRAKCEIIYFADQKSYPYGTARPGTLRGTIQKSIKSLDGLFAPDLIIVASNTPSLLFPDMFGGRIIGILPPVARAQKISRHTVCILATRSVVTSGIFKRYVAANSAPGRVLALDASPLVNLVESGKIFSDGDLCRRRIARLLSNYFDDHDIDVATLSSTHLPFLLPMLRDLFPRVSFLDPAGMLAEKISKRLSHLPPSPARLRIFASGDPAQLQKKLARLRIKNMVRKIAL